MKFYCGKLQQYIDIQSILQYIDTLKTRIYKAFCQKSRSQAYYLQLFCVNSPLVTLMATKSSMEDLDYCLGFFELGYLVFSLSNNFYIDTSFYTYYRENTLVDINYLFYSLIEKAKCTSVIWSIEPYQSYLFHKTNFFCQFDNSYDLNSAVFSEVSPFKYALCFNAESCFSYLHICILTKRLSINQKIKSYLLKYLNQVKYSDLMSYFGFLSRHAVLLRGSKQLPVKLFSMFIYFICTDIYTAFNALSQCRSSILFTGHNFVLLILSQDYLGLKLLAKELSTFLRFNGVKLIHVLHDYSASLLDGITCNLLSIGTQSSAYPFYFLIRPSLFSQFALMCRISFIMSYSVSQPLFLLIIRLNKFMLFWAYIYFPFDIGRTFYLIDYLVYLKIRLFIKKHCFFKRSLSNLLFLRLNGDKGVITLNKLSDSLVESIFTCRQYRHYMSVRMFWIHVLKCLSI